MIFMRVEVRIALTVIAGIAVCSAAVGQAQVTLVLNGQPKACVIGEKNPDDRDRDVLNDFVGIVQRMTGAALPLGKVEGAIPIYVGETANFDSLPFDVPVLEPEEFLLKVTPSAIYILGGSSLGTGHGAYTLLRSLGCRWVVPGAIGECLPETKEISLPVHEERGKPDFRYREIVYAYGCDADAAARRAEWLRRNRMYRPDVLHTHNLTTTLERAAPFTERPELYALNEGQRKKTQVCTSNPETVRLIVKSIKEYLVKHPQTQAYSLCPDDNTDFCECDACRALDTGQIDRGGLPSVADRYQAFLNQVLAGLKDEYPNVLVSTYSYNRSHTDPPAHTKVDPRTCIFATASEFCSAHGIGDTDCPSRQDFRGLLTQWLAATPHVYIYEYDPVPYSGGLPWPMWESHAREMAAYKSIGVKGIYFEGQNSWASYFPNYYVAAQCMWDSSRDGDAIFADMMNTFFREATPEMIEYHRSLASAFHGIEKRVVWGLVDYPKYFTADIVERCRKSLEAAEARAASDIVKQRIQMVRFSFDEMDAYLKIRRADAATPYEDYKKTIEKLNGAIDQMASVNEDYLLAWVAKEKTNAGLADRYAKEQGFINEWLLCGPFDNLGMDGHDRVYLPEERIDPKAEYPGKNGKTIAWKPSRTPEWQGYVDLFKEFDETEWVCAYALCWVTLDGGPRDVMFRVGSNDSVKVFLNGTQAWSNKIERAAQPDNDLVPVTLPKGTSAILVKIGQTGRNWGFYFRITERDSLAIPAGLHVSRKPPE